VPLSLSLSLTVTVTLSVTLSLALTRTGITCASTGLILASVFRMGLDVFGMSGFPKVRSHIFDQEFLVS
jgi:hypothetical protein